MARYTVNSSIIKAAHKLHYRTEFQGIPISIENRKNSNRNWKTLEGEDGVTKIKYPYGYIRGTMGYDGDQFDVYLGPNKKSKLVFIVKQHKHNDTYDESKLMLGFDDPKSALKGYSIHNDLPRISDIEIISIESLKNLIKDSEII